MDNGLSGQNLRLMTKSARNYVSKESPIDVFVCHFLDFGGQTTISEIRARRLKGRHA